MNNIPNTAEIEAIADTSLACIVSYGTPKGQDSPLDEKLSKAIRHYLIQAMVEVRNKTVWAEKDLLKKILDDLTHAASL